MAKKWKKTAMMLAALATSAVTAVSLTACGGNDKESSGGGTEKTGMYTYRLATNSLPTAWNTHTYQSNSAVTYVLDYTEDGLYAFDYNDTKDGYRIVPSMAAEMPADVSSVYAGTTWNIGSSDAWKAIPGKTSRRFGF